MHTHSVHLRCVKVVLISVEMDSDKVGNNFILLLNSNSIPPLFLSSLSFIYLSFLFHELFHKQRRGDTPLH